MGCYCDDSQKIVISSHRIVTTLCEGKDGNKPKNTSRLKCQYYFCFLSTHLITIVLLLVWNGTVVREQNVRLYWESNRSTRRGIPSWWIQAWWSLFWSSENVWPSSNKRRIRTGIRSNFTKLWWPVSYQNCYIKRQQKRKVRKVFRKDIVHFVRQFLESFLRRAEIPAMFLL